MPVTRNDVRTPEALAKIQSMRDQGCKLDEIALALGCSKRLISTIIQEYGIGPRKSILELQLEAALAERDQAPKAEMPKAPIAVAVDRGQFEVLGRNDELSAARHREICNVRCKTCGEVLALTKLAMRAGHECPQPQKRQKIDRFNNVPVGQRFGMLKTLGTAFKKNGKTYWDVICDCGNITAKRTDHLLGQGCEPTLSCGCKRISRGELKIKQLLDEHYPYYRYQYQLSTLSVDFAIFDKDGSVRCFLEYDGEMHSQPVKHYGGEKNLEACRARDERKNKICEALGIPLVRIPYTDYDKIDWGYLKNAVNSVIRKSKKSQTDAKDSVIRK